MEENVTRSYIGAPMTSQNCLDDENAIKVDICKNTALYCECRRMHKEEANLTNLYLSSLFRFWPRLDKMKICQVPLILQF